MTQDNYRIIKRPLITEKGMTGVNARNQYPFEVEISANKDEIKRAVEEIFSVHVQKVRTMMRTGKPRRYKHWQGTTSRWKRAIITIAPGENIAFI